MITKEQALTCKNFVQVKKLNGTIKLKYGTIQQVFVPDGTTSDIKPIKWRANGQCKTWKSEKNKHRFSLPIKHGLYQFGYITEENTHLFEVAYESI